MPFDRLAGGPALRQQIEADAPLDSLAAAWDVTAEGWRKTRRACLLYEDIDHADRS
jgi:hypothetical protein